MSAYPNLFKQPSAPSAATSETTPIPDMLPLQQAKEEVEKGSSIIDSVLVKKVGPERLLRLKAMEWTMKFLVGRTSNVENVGLLYDVIFEKLKNGTKTRPQIR